MSGDNIWITHIQDCSSLTSNMACSDTSELISDTSELINYALGSEKFSTIPKLMKTVGMLAPGSPDVLFMTEVPIPVPVDRQVLHIFAPFIFIYITSL